MASIKISQLPVGGSIKFDDELPVSRGGFETYRILANQIVTTGGNIGGAAEVYKNSTATDSTTLNFRSLSGVGEGIQVIQTANTINISISGQNPSKNVFTGTGSQVNFALTNASSRNVNNYRVDIDGVLQEPGQTADYYLDSSNLVFTTPPPSGSKVVVVSNNLLPLVEAVPANNSITNAMFTDGCINTPELSSGAVTTDKIALSAVTANRISLVTSLSTRGYQIMPGGLIMQWGRIDSINFNQTNQGPYTYPISFPNNCLNIVTTIIYDTAINGVWNANVNTVTLSSFRVFGDYDTGTGAAPIYWQAIGY